MYITIPRCDEEGRELIESERRASGITQRDLCEEVGISYRSYQHYVTSGERDPSVTTWVALCDAVGLVIEHETAPPEQGSRVQLVK